MVGAASGNDTVQQDASHREENMQRDGVDEAIEEAVTADAVPDQQKEAFTGAATVEDQQKERTPIVWVGRPKEPSAATPSVAAEAPATANDNTAERPVQRLKPNAGFLLNLVADAERGNKRKCAEEATQVSLNVLGQAVAAGVRPQLARVGPDATDAAVRRVVLSVAQQQKLATCSALLREVAASFGFALHIAPDVGDEDLEDGEETTASAGEGGDGSGTGSLTNGNSAADRERPGFQALQALRVRLNLASQREKAKLNNAGPAFEDDADTALRPPKPRAPGINMAANRLAGAALGAIGVAVPDKAHAPARPSHSHALQKLSATGEGRTAIFGHDEEDGAMSEADLEDLEDLDEGDVEVNGKSADVDSAGQSADDQPPPTTRSGIEPGTAKRNAFSSRVMRQLGVVGSPAQTGSEKHRPAAKVTSESPAPHLNGSKLSRRSLSMVSPGLEQPDGKLEGSEEGQPPPGMDQRRGVLRMDAHKLLDELEEDLEGSDNEQAAAGNRPRKSPTPGSGVDSMTRKKSQSGTLASRAGVTDAGRQVKQAAAVQPAVDMGRLLSRASAAATGAQQRRDANEWASADAAAGSSADDVDDPDVPPAARSGITRNGAAPTQSGKRTAQGVLASAARQLKRAREEDEGSDGRARWELRDQDGDGKSDRFEEDKKERMNVKSGGRAGRGLFGAAMAGLNGRCTQ